MDNRRVLREILCNIVVVLKEHTGMTYDQIVEISEGKINKTQLTNILKHNGKGVSSDLIYDVIIELGYGLEVKVFNSRIGGYI